MGFKLSGRPLRFNAAAAKQGLLNALMLMAHRLAQEFQNEIYNALKTTKGKEALGDAATFLKGEVIESEIIATVWAILDAYGTGSEMDTTNPALQGYRGSSLWNPMRTDTDIVGRPAGTYVDIFGNTRTSSGKMSGRNLEQLSKGGVKTIAPSFAFQNAWMWLKAGNRIGAEFHKTVQAFDFSAYFTN